MKLAKSLFSACIICGLTQLSTYADSKWVLSSEDGVDLQIDVTQLPSYPHALTEAGYLEGFVKVSVDVDHHGELRDWIIVESTHPSFTQSVERVIEKWEFSAPKVNGEPRSIITHLNINFKSSGAVLSMSLPSEMLAQRINQMSGYRSQYRGLTSINDLDTSPFPLDQPSPRVPQQLVDEYEESQASFNFYVDEAGQVRMPALVETKGDPDVQLLVAAQDAISQWKFEPPTRNKRPVKIRLSQTFVFANR
ncbi:TonB family protein [Pelagicoccus mobilis]|uniref:TonB family protein n=1 Tax=Pelagicoccus mobilis TaxID=415221 RepID=A0A934RTY9_9BACT|nr:TonB family protein [Pelagicoccus mobilis]MBK1876388.1 TonB family protein [Pelagicoccus mobilis]